MVSANEVGAAAGVVEGAVESPPPPPVIHAPVIHAVAAPIPRYVRGGSGYGYGDGSRVRSRVRMYELLIRQDRGG